MHKRRFSFSLITIFAENPQFHSRNDDSSNRFGTEGGGEKEKEKRGGKEREKKKENVRAKHIPDVANSCRETNLGFTGRKLVSAFFF